MPCKDKEKQRQAQREWAARARKKNNKKILENKKRYREKLKADPERYKGHLEKEAKYRKENHETIKDAWRKYSKTRKRTWSKSEKGLMLKTISKQYLLYGDYAIANIYLNNIRRSIKNGEEKEETRIKLEKFERYFVEYLKRCSK